MAEANGIALIEGFGSLSKAIRTSIEKSISVFIYGTPGIGKTAAPIAVAKAIDADYLLVDCVTREATDFAGLPRATDDGFAEFVPYGFARKMIDATKQLIVILDDLAQSPLDVQKAIMRLVHDRLIGEYRISDHVFFIGTGNSREDRAGSSGLIEPLKSRFASLIQFRPLLSDWITEYAIPQGIDPLLIAFLKFRPALFSAFEARPDYVQSPSPRTWSHAARILAAGYDARTEFALMQGSIGPVAAAEFQNMRSLLSTMPDPLAVLDSIRPNDSTLAAIRGGGCAMQFTFAAALSGKCAGENQYRNGAAFLQRINAECLELFSMLATKRDPRLQESRTYAELVSGTFRGKN